MKLLHKTKKKNYIYLTDKDTIIKSGGITVQEPDIQKKAYELGIAPQIYNVKYNNRCPEFMEMEYIKGDTLEDYLKKNINMDRSQIKKLVREAEDLLYNNGINHGDLTGKNIIVTPLIQIKIIDYGSSIQYPEPILQRLRVYHHF